MDFDLLKITRKNIVSLVPYSSARNEYTGNGAILLDANESPFNRPLNRYPDPLQKELKLLISEKIEVPSEMIFLGNGSDEAIDLLMRAFCEPGKSEIISIDPSYGMYEVSANINDLKVIKVLLNDDFSLSSNRILESITDKTRLIFLCSPNNPTGNLLDTAEIEKITKNFSGIVVLDEAYIDFSGTNGMLDSLNKIKNLVILRTFSKAWGLAGVRLGMAIGDPSIIKILNKIKFPYNVNVLTQRKVKEMLSRETDKNSWVSKIISERKNLMRVLVDFEFIEMIYPSDSNFLLVRMKEPRKVYQYLVDKKMIVRDRSKVSLCEGCLRITVGSQAENEKLVKLLKKYSAKNTTVKN